MDRRSRIGSEVEVWHQGMSSFQKDTLSKCHCFENVGDAVDVRRGFAQKVSGSMYLISLNPYSRFISKLQSGRNAQISLP